MDKEDPFAYVDKLDQLLCAIVKKSLSSHCTVFIRIIYLHINYNLWLPFSLEQVSNVFVDV